MLEPCEAKVSCTVPRGLGAGDSPRLPDVNGKPYICYYTEFGPGASISNSLKEGEINRTVGLTAKYTSHQLDVMEKRLSAGQS